MEQYSLLALSLPVPPISWSEVTPERKTSLRVLIPAFLCFRKLIPSGSSLVLLHLTLSQQALSFAPLLAKRRRRLLPDEHGLS
jgi:hypothetical protein